MYQKMYTTLFNAITDALRDLADNDPDAAASKLILTQQQAEEIFISAGNAA
mgnify:FL=1